MSNGGGEEKSTKPNYNSQRKPKSIGQEFLQALPLAKFPIRVAMFSIGR